MKIGCYIQHFPYEDRQDPQYHKQYKHGGAEIAAFDLAINLAKRGHEVTIFATSITHKDSIEKNKYMTIYRYGKNFRVSESNISFGLLHKPFKFQFDVIHAHLSVKIDGLAALLHANRKKIPLVATHHADTNVYSGFIHKSGLVSLYSKYLTNLILSHADVIISPSEYYINESRFLGKYRDKIVAIPYGVNIEEFDISYSKEKCRAKLGFPIDENIILFVGNLIAYKGPEVLVKAMPRIVKEVPNTKLIFVGSGEMKEELKRLSKNLGVNKYVKFAGFVEGNLKSMHYRAADVFCLPSTLSTESFGIVNLEAMACGIPIVASKIGGIPAVVKDGENGLLVPPKDSRVLADAIIYLLENENRREKMGKDGRKKAEDYSWSRIAEETERVYKRVISE